MAEAHPGGPPPHVQLIQMGTAYWTSRLIVTAAELGIADLLAKGPRPSSDVAATLGLLPSATYRFMRSLAGLGVLTEASEGVFALTPLGEALKAGAPGAARSSVIMLAGDIVQPSWDHFKEVLKTGQTGFEIAFGKPLFDYLSDKPEAISMFSETMVGFHGGEPPAVAAAYDFSQFKSVVDIGGATGNMLCHILAKHPKVRGVLFDLPHVVADAPAFIAARGMTDRISIEGGSFFETAPAGHDAYVMSHIIHDWNPDQCATILSNCRRAIAPGGKLLIVETVLPEGDVPHMGKMLDMMMMIGPGGQERTAKEYGALLSRSGFRLTKVVPTESAVGIVEAVAV